MRSLWGRLLSAGAVIASSLALVACWHGRRADHVAVAIVDWPAYEYLYLASQVGLDRSEGYTLKVKQFGSLRDQRMAYQRGDLEVIATTLPEALAICRDVPSRCPLLVLVLDQSDGADQIYGSSSLTSMAALKGQRVGLEPGILGEFMLMRALQKVGLPLTAVQRVYAPPRALVSQLMAGDLAAIVTYNPYSEALQQSDRWRLLFSSRDVPGEVVDVLAVSPELKRRDPSLVNKLISTWWSARRYAATHSRDALALMAQRQGITPAEFQRQEQGIAYPDRADQARLLAPDGPIQAALERLRQQMRAADRLPPDLALPRLERPAQR